MKNLLTLDDLTGKKRGVAVIEYRRDPEDPPTIPDEEYLSTMAWYGDRIKIVDCKGAESTATFKQIRLDEYGDTWRCWRKMPTDEERQEAQWNDP